MTERICKYCEGEVTSTNPAIDYCRDCYYLGSWLFDEPSFRPLFDDLGGEASPAHTGGGCFVIEVNNGATYLWASQDGDAGLPETADGPWWIFQYRRDSDDEPVLVGEHLDRAGLVAAVEAVR